MKVAPFCRMTLISRALASTAWPLCLAAFALTGSGPASAASPVLEWLSPDWFRALTRDHSCAVSARRSSGTDHRGILPAQIRDVRAATIFGPRTQDQVLAVATAEGLGTKSTESRRDLSVHPAQAGRKAVLLMLERTDQGGRQPASLKFHYAEAPSFVGPVFTFPAAPDLTYHFQCIPLQDPPDPNGYPVPPRGGPGGGDSRPISPGGSSPAGGAAK